MLNYIFISQAQDFINLNWTALQDKDDEVDQFEDTLKITSWKQITRNALKLLLAAWREDLETVKFLTDKNTKNHFRKTNMETLLFMQLHRVGV